MNSPAPKFSFHDYRVMRFKSEEYDAWDYMFTCQLITCGFKEKVRVFNG